MIRWSPWIAGAFAALFVIASMVTLHWNPRRGVLFSLTGGCARVFSWDPALHTIAYKARLSLEPAANLDWFGTFRWNEPFSAGGPPSHQYTVALPLWLPAVASFALWAVARRRGWGRELWQCARCRYDKRGLAPNTPCPECGQ